jgi:DNA-binding LytR/AlgR family response regulator
VTATPPENPLLPSAVRGGVLRATADLQYVHLHSPEGMTTVPGPMRRVIGLLGDQGLEVRRGEWIADRHVKQVKAVRGRWVVLLKDGQQIAVSRRRLIEVKERWGLTRYA